MAGSLAGHARPPPDPHRARRASRPPSPAGARARPPPSTGCSRSTPSSAALAAERDEVRAQVKAVSKEVGRLRGQGEADEAEAPHGREPRARRAGEGAGRRGRPARRRDPRRCSCASPTCRATTRPTAPARPTTWCCAPRASTPTPTASTSGCRTGTSATELGILDLERAAKISGSMFTMYRGWGARLLRALVQLSLDRNADAYEEIRPPTLVRTETMMSTGHLPKFDDDAYHVERDDLWAIPTAEVPLTSLHRDEILDEADLPLRLHGLHVVLPARGRLGRADTRGLLRSPRVRQGRAAGGRGRRPSRPSPARRTCSPAARRCSATSASPTACSTCAPATSATRPPARGTSRPTPPASTSGSRCRRCRGSPTTRPAGPTSATGRRPTPTTGGQPKGTEVCHTVNGSAMGWPRTVAAYLETHRQPDGSVGDRRRPAPLPRRRGGDHRALEGPDDRQDRSSASGAGRAAARQGEVLRRQLEAVVGPQPVGQGVERVDRHLDDRPA